MLNDSDFLRTLQPRDKIAGIAEAVKVALIRDRKPMHVTAVINDIPTTAATTPSPHAGSGAAP